VVLGLRTADPKLMQCRLGVRGLGFVGGVRAWGLDRSRRDFGLVSWGDW